MQERGREVKMDCSFLVSNNINDILMCTMQASGLGLEIFALVIMGIFVVFAAAARLEINISLALAWVISYSLMVLTGNASYILQVLFGIITIGVALRLLIGFIGIFRQ